jgi:transposase
MPRPTPLPLRDAVLRRYRKGQSVRQIAEELDLPERTVRRLVERIRRRGDGGIIPDYRHPAPPPDAARSAVHGAALDLRRAHPKWGAEYLRINLRRMGHHVPSARTLQRWLRQAGLAPAPAGRPPRGDPSRAAAPHDVWQMDACEHLPLKTGEASWLRLVDECSGAVLLTVVFPPRLLGASRGRTGPGGPAPGVRAVGAARAGPDRQWHAVGGDGWAADGADALVGRVERRGHLEPRPATAEECRRRTVPGRRAGLARAAVLLLGGGAPGARRRLRRHPTGGVSRDRWPNPDGGIPRTEAFGTIVSGAGRGPALVVAAGAGLAVGARGAAAGQSQREGLLVRPGPLGRSAAHRETGLGDIGSRPEAMGDHGREERGVETSRSCGTQCRADSCPFGVARAP